MPVSLSPRRRGSIRKSYISIPAFAGMFFLLAFPAQAQQYKIIHMSTGTGFFVSRDGYVLTNAHVIDKCDSAQVTGAGVDTSADIITKDSKNDIALLRVRATPVASAVFRSSSMKMQEGAPVVVIGHPLGQKLTTRAAQFIANSGPLNEPQWLRFTSSVFQGNSGGPLLDASGQVIGMIMAKATTFRYNDGRAKSEVVANADVAIQPYKLAELLERYNVDIQYGTNNSELSPHRVEDNAKNFVVQVKCRLD